MKFVASRLLESVGLTKERVIATRIRPINILLPAFDSTDVQVRRAFEQRA